MLVLSRKPGETLRIGPDIVMTIVSIHGNKVRVGIDAPSEVHIARGELEDRPVVDDSETPHVPPSKLQT